MAGTDCGEFGGVLFRLEAGVALADGGFAEAFARFQGGDVFGDVPALVHEFGIGLDEADELLAAHLLLARPLLGEAGDKPHDVVVIDDGGGEEHELEIHLINVPAGRITFLATFVLLGFELLGGLQILTTEAEQVFLRQYVLDGGGVFLREVGVLVELGFEALDFLEVVDESRLGGVALEIRNFGGGGGESLGFHEAVELLYRHPPAS